MTSPESGGKIRGVTDEVVVISLERRARSCGAQLAAGVRIIALGDDVTRLVFRLLPFPSRIASSHVCAYWRALAVSDPLLWTVLDGDPTLIPVLWARAGSAVIEVRLDLYDSSLEDVVSCISNNLDRMTGIKVLADPEDFDNPPVAEWMTVLNIFSRPAVHMRRLHLESPFYMDPDIPIRPSFPLAGLGPTSHLQKLALLRTDVLDFTVLPATLTSFAYGDPGSLAEWSLTFQDLQIILQTCPEMETLWLAVSMDLFDFNITSQPPIQLREVTLGIFAGDLTQLLDFLSLRSLRRLDVGGENLIHNVLQAFAGNTMSILLASIDTDYTCCDIVVSDSQRRSWRVRCVDFMQMVDNLPVWLDLVSLTLCSSDSVTLTQPPPDMPRLESLRILYEPRDGFDIGTMVLWEDGHSSWQCPALHTVTFAPVEYRSVDGRPPPKVTQPIAVRGLHIQKFVARHLSQASAHVSRVIVKGISIQLELDADEQLPFSLSHDPSDCAIYALDDVLVFNGFDSE